MLSTLELLQKYDVPGPRYTSYPTVPIWTETVGTADYKKALNAIQDDETLSLYFHLPFCEKLCHFCGCMQVITKDHSRSAPYIKTLLSEIDQVAKELGSKNKKVSQIHFGGGTPNFVSPDELSAIMSSIRDNFSILEDAEIAIEMHPRTSTQLFCDRLKKEGFNRISLGVQSFDDNVQALINRYQTFRMTKEMLDYLRSIGFKSFNFDLVYGLPGQTKETFQKTLEQTLDLKPNRLAVYSYAHVPWVRPVQRSFKDSDIPSPELKLELCEMAHGFFTQNGFKMVGMDHYADESDDLYQALQEKSIHRNFMGYTTKADAHQIGMGVTSISYVNGHYFQNQKKYDDYVQVVDGGELATFRGFLLSDEDKLRRDLITELMCQMEINTQKFSEDHKIDFDEYFKEELMMMDDFVQDELMSIKDGKVDITQRGTLVLRNIAMCFDQHLDAIKKKARNPVFSRTV